MAMAACQDTATAPSAEDPGAEMGTDTTGSTPPETPGAESEGRVTMDVADPSGTSEASDTPSDVPSESASDETIVTETVDEDVDSPTVKIRLIVMPRTARAFVYWGREKLGEAPLVLTRPRRSGPMDVVIRARGYLDYYTRLFTDRDDKLMVTLVKPNEAGHLVGYRQKPDAGPPPSSGGRADAGVKPLRDAGASFRAKVKMPDASTFAAPDTVSF
jgi:hypothetical protein